jgi:hypothetical protein
MHGVRDDFGAAISAGFVEANPTMPCLTATHVPLPHLLHTSRLRILQRSPRILDSIENIAVILSAEAKIWFRDGILSQREEAPASNYFSNHRFLRHFGAEMVLPLPLRHSTNENHQVERTFLFEAVLGKDNPVLDVYNWGTQPATPASCRARFRSGSAAGNKWRRP